VARSVRTTQTAELLVSEPYSDRVVHVRADVGIAAQFLSSTGRLGQSREHRDCSQSCVSHSHPHTRPHARTLVLLGRARGGHLLHGALCDPRYDRLSSSWLSHCSCITIEKLCHVCLHLCLTSTLYVASGPVSGLNEDVSTDTKLRNFLVLYAVAWIFIMIAWYVGFGQIALAIS
jgi:hypothetical protein